MLVGDIRRSGFENGQLLSNGTVQWENFVRNTKVESGVLNPKLKSVNRHLIKTG